MGNKRVIVHPGLKTKRVTIKLYKRVKNNMLKIVESHIAPIGVNMEEAINRFSKPGLETKICLTNKI